MAVGNITPKNGICTDYNWYSTDFVPILKNAFHPRKHWAKCTFVPMYQLFPSLCVRENFKIKNNRKTITRARRIGTTAPMANFPFDAFANVGMSNFVAQNKISKDAHFAMRMPQTMLANLRRVAAADGRTASNTALRFIAAGIAETMPDRTEATEA